MIPVYVNEQQVTIKRCGGESFQTSNNLLYQQNQAGGILGYKPQANSLMQAQPSPMMTAGSISQGPSINKRTLEQLQQIQKEQQVQREKEQQEAIEQQQKQVEHQQNQAMAQARDRLNQQNHSMLIEQQNSQRDPNTLSSGFAQSFYGDFGSQSNSLLNGPYNANNLGSAGAIQQAPLNPMQAYMNNLKTPAQAGAQNPPPSSQNQHIQMITNHHVAQMPTLHEGMSLHPGIGGEGGFGEIMDYGKGDMVGRIGTTANVGVSKQSASTYYTKGMTYP